MGLLEGRTALVFGVANDHSIAWGVAKAFSREGAMVGLSYAAEPLERRVRPLAKSISSTFVEKCDVSSDEEIGSVMERAKTEFGGIDILVHSIAFANREELKGPFYMTSREGFHLAIDISVYSLIALVQAAMEKGVLRPNGSVLTMTHHGSRQVFENYHVMGVAKAMLETFVEVAGGGIPAAVRYLAQDLGSKGIRVNGISAGPINTAAARGIPGFVEILKAAPSLAPLKRGVTQEDVGGAAVYLCSCLAAGVTGQVLYVDAGLSTIAFAKGG